MPPVSAFASSDWHSSFLSDGRQGPALSMHIIIGQALHPMPGCVGCWWCQANAARFLFGQCGALAVPTQHMSMPSFLCAGSSAGSAASVAARIAPWSLCEDTGGSCRAPAIANGERPACLDITWEGSLLEHDLRACLSMTWEPARLPAVVSAHLRTFLAGLPACTV